MTWIATDNFDSYTATNDLNTLNGGTNWTAAWAKVGTGAMTIETAPAGGQGGNAVRSNSANGNAEYSRTFTAISAGTLSVRMRISIANPGNSVGVFISDATNNLMFVRFGPTGNIEIYNQDTTVYESIQAYSVDTWYTIDIDFDDAAQNDRYRARVNGGAYTAYKGAQAAYTSVTILTLSDLDTSVKTMWFDDVKPASAAGELRRIVVTRSS